MGVLDEVKAALGERVKDSHEQKGDATVAIDGRDLLDVVGKLREIGFDFLADLTAVDYLEMPANQRPPNRFEAVYHLYSFSKNARLRVRARLDDREPRIASLSKIWSAADPMEREAWDMYGIRFDG